MGVADGHKRWWWGKCHKPQAYFRRTLASHRNAKQSAPRQALRANIILLELIFLSQKM